MTKPTVHHITNLFVERRKEKKNIVSQTKSTAEFDSKDYIAHKNEVNEPPC